MVKCVEYFNLLEKLYILTLIWVGLLGAYLEVYVRWRKITPPPPPLPVKSRYNYAKNLKFGT